MQVAEDFLRTLADRVKLMETEREPWWPVWQDLSDYFLPRRYPWLQTVVGQQGRSQKPQVRNSKLLDSTSSRALRTLATGMMNGITSPARPWFRLGLRRRKWEELPHAVAVWLEDASAEVLAAMGRSNFYNALGLLYVEWCCFGTASMGIYEDYESVFRCKNFALGEFYLSSDADGRVNRHARRFVMPIEQIAAKWGTEGLTEEQRAKLAPEARPSERATPYIVCCLLEPNDPPAKGVRKSAKFREVYWIEGNSDRVLTIKTRDRGHINPRWETYADDTYGSSPAMEALPDVLQLQQMTLRRGQGLDKTVSPPMLAHQSLASKPKAFVPGGVTYVTNADLQQGARPTYQVNIPFQELNLDIIQLQTRIKETLFNDLFRMIADLQTVRSASEIDARREEKYVLLGPVLERFETEGLAPCIEAVFQIMLSGGLLPPLPPELEDEDLEIQYISVMSDAQRAVGTIPTERFMQLIGSVAQMYPNAVELPDWDEMLRDYARDTGVKQSHLREKEEATARMDAQDQGAQLAQAADVGQKLASGAAQLSQADVGGGANALQALMAAG